MDKIERNFENLSEFIDNLSRGGEIEFIYKNKKYSITHPEGKICFIEQNNDISEKIFNNIQELLKYTIGDEKIEDVVTEIQVFFRCF